MNELLLVIDDDEYSGGGGGIIEGYIYYSYEQGGKSGDWSNQVNYNTYTQCYSFDQDYIQYGGILLFNYYYVYFGIGERDTFIQGDMNPCGRLVLIVSEGDQCLNQECQRGDDYLIFGDDCGDTNLPYYQLIYDTSPGISDGLVSKEEVVVILDYYQLISNNIFGDLYSEGGFTLPDFLCFLIFILCSILPALSMSSRSRSIASRSSFSQSDSYELTFDNLR
ncbi:MAG: hypothetical protein EZS28_014651 [Streblomastix strix]|uniref:Uncharacterized protein n=1 Tax=Streblomastix strix TaxID=222440 RepID=A0A5J4W5J5_9EUKA|nr:MAG: hypothetical protein EZS28_014651 [Streblomastix strix]